MNREDFINEIKKLNINITNEQLKELDLYLEFLIEYNNHTNLTAITKEEDIYLKHFYDSLTIVKAVNLNDYHTLLDIGSGAGFPGFVLKIIFPKLEVTLIDSNNKKTTFLKELSKKLKIDISIVNMRVEEYAKNNLNRFDIVTSRAVANLRVLSELSIPLVKLNGLFIPMKGILDKNLEDSLETINILHCEVINQITFNLYNNSGIRNILVIKKFQESNSDILRTYDKILKKPLKNNSK